MLIFFLIFSTVCWGIAEIFYKLGNTADEKYAHLKTTMFVGFFFGAYALVILFTQGVDLQYFGINFLKYLPVALCYIVSMACSYFGVRFIKESISDPIENTSCVFVPILCAIFAVGDPLDWKAWIAVAVTVIGILGVSVFDKHGKEERHSQYGKKLAVLGILMPFCYMALDTVGTFLDCYYTDSVDATALVHVTEENLEHTANCCYELTFFLIAIGILIYLKAKHVKIFSTGAEKVDENGVVVRQNWIQKVFNQKWKILAAIFETGGQATYLFALSEGAGLAAVFMGAGTVIISFILSRIFLKEKLTWLQYIFIALIFAGIIAISLLGF